MDETSPHPQPPVAQVVLRLRGVELERALLMPGRFVIGRTSDNDMQVDSKYVSRHHAQLVTGLDGCVVEDLNSTNGIYLNGKRVRRHRLAPGDVVKIGIHELVFERYEATAPAEDPRATQTTALTETDFELDDEPEGQEPDQDDATYSSIARGS
jgi:predicted component of type VI protein secretion system